MGAQQSSGIGNLFSSTAHHVVMLGLDSAGKTTGKVFLQQRFCRKQRVIKLLVSKKSYCVIHEGTLARFVMTIALANWVLFMIHVYDLTAAYMTTQTLRLGYSSTPSVWVELKCYIFCEKLAISHLLSCVGNPHTMQSFINCLLEVTGQNSGILWIYLSKTKDESMCTYM